LDVRFFSGAMIFNMAKDWLIADCDTIKITRAFKQCFFLYITKTIPKVAHHPASILFDAQFILIKPATETTVQ